MNYEVACTSDEKLLKDLLESDRHCVLKSYDVQVGLFYKYGKYDKEGNLKTPALTKYGISIPAQVKIVSAFNRLTDDTDVKITLNKEMWDELSQSEKKAVLDNMLSYIQIKEDKEGEPIMISEDSDKVQLKMRKPDFYCEGFLEMVEEYGKSYLPWQDAKNIADKVN